ncbi:MAG TPA: hypothetical protein VMT76_00750 [Puia sp.]|nr:hypothetical protein [Puia sp.]
MRIFVSTLLFIGVLFFCCKNKTTSKSRVNNSKEDSVVKPLNASVINSHYSNSELRVSAYLIYNDGTLSTFDILNDKTIALWNVIAGGGDALKPSDSIKIDFNGDMDSLNIKVKNGRKLVIDTTTIHSEKGFNFIIRNTGCFEVFITVKRNKTVVYNDTIPFHCGE